jgi:hypothetical protein
VPELCARVRRVRTDHLVDEAKPAQRAKQRLVRVQQRAEARGLERVGRIRAVQVRDCALQEEEQVSRAEYVPVTAQRR